MGADDRSKGDRFQTQKRRGYEGSEYKVTEENDAMEEHQTGRIGQLVERVVRKNGGGSFGEVQSRGELSNWNGESSRELRETNFGSGVMIAGRESTHGSGNTACNEAKKEEMRQQQRMKSVTDMTEEEEVRQQQTMRIVTRTTVSWWVSELVSAGCTSVAPPRMGGHSAAMENWLHEMKWKNEEKRREEEHQKLSAV